MQQAAMEFLRQRFPKCFFTIGEERPLKLSIKQDLANACQTERWPCQEHIFVQALQEYTHSKTYLSAITTDALRVDLDGNPAGCVTFAEHQSAQFLLNKTGILSHQGNAL